MKDAFGILTFYYVLMGGYYFIDILSEKIKKKVMEDNKMTESEMKFRDTTIRNFFDKEDRLKSIPGQKKKN